MSKPTLAELLYESALAAEQERQAKNRFDRIVIDVKKHLAAKAKRAETSKDYPTCPHCGGVLEGWRPDDVTGDSESNDDPDNEQDNVAAKALNAKYASRHLTVVDRI